LVKETAILTLCVEDVAEELFISKKRFAALVGFLALK
jgi:hypothetical protein